MQFLLSPRVAALRDFAPDMSQINLDEERSLSRLREISWGDHAVSMQLVSNTDYCRQVRDEHERIGGVVRTGAPTSKELQSEQLEVLERKVVKPKKEGVGKMTAWTMYFRERISPQWDQAQAASQTLQSRYSEASEGGQTKRASAKKKFRAVQAESGPTNDKTVWVKGAGDWMTWTDFFKTMTRKYNENRSLQETFARKALEWNANHPDAVIDLIAKPALRDEDTFWGMGSAVEPLRAELVDEETARRQPELDESHPSAKRLPGPVRCARQIIEERDGNLFFTDPRLPGPLPALEHERKLCWQQHPGLCEQRDACVADVVKAITQNLNTITAFKCTGPGKSEYDMIARVLRFDFLVTRAEEPDVFFRRVADVWVCHARLDKPQVQILAPIKEVKKNEWVFRFSKGEIYAHTSYHQIKLNCLELIRKGLRLHNVYLHEKFLAPCFHTSQEALQDGIVRLQPVGAQMLGVKPLADDFGEVIEILSSAISQDKRFTRRRNTTSDAGVAAEVPVGGETDEFTAAVEESIEKKRQAVMDKYMEEVKKAFLGLKKKPAGGGKRKKTTPAAGNGAGKAAGKAAGGDKAGDGDGAESGEDHEASDHSGDSGDEGDDADGPMDWELERWRRLQIGVPLPVPMSPAEIPGLDNQQDVFPAPDPPLPWSPTPAGPSDGPPAGVPGAAAAESAAEEAVAPPLGALEETRMIDSFGPHKLNVVVPSNPGGARLPNECAVAVYAVCGQHLDSMAYRPQRPDGSVKPVLQCRQQLAITNDDTGCNIDEVCLQLKKWLVYGYGVACGCPELDPVAAAGPADAAGPDCRARKRHMALKAKKLTANPTEEDLAKLPIGPGQFSTAELDIFRR